MPRRLCWNPFRPVIIIMCRYFTYYGEYNIVISVVYNYYMHTHNAHTRARVHLVRKTEHTSKRICILSRVWHFFISTLCFPDIETCSFKRPTNIISAPIVIGTHSIRANKPILWCFWPCTAADTYETNVFLTPRALRLHYTSLILLNLSHCRSR